MEDCPDGRMDREKMKQMFNSIMPKVYLYLYSYPETHPQKTDSLFQDDPNEANPGTSAEQFLDQLFRIFDKVQKEKKK